MTSLHLNEKLETLNCYQNQLSSLLTKNLKVLSCSNNQLTSLHSIKLETLNCCNNQLTSLHLNDIQTLYCDNNPIYEIVNHRETKIMNQNLKRLNRFRYLYYCLKFKKRFRDWLWVKIREPKIQLKYSHDYLVEHLHEDTDLDELLQNW